MSWLYSRALVEAYSQANSWAGKQFAPSKLMPMPQAYLSPDKMTAFSRPSQFGMTFGLLMDDRGVELLTWFREVFLVRTSASPAKEPESAANNQGSGWKCPGSLARYDHDSFSWKTRQYLLSGELTEFSGPWPPWGMMRDGELSALTISTEITAGNGYGLLPTPRASDGPGQYVATLKTAITRVGKKHRHQGHWIHVYLFLTNLKKGWANPRFSEWIMAWPDGWTDLEPLEMDKIRAWRRRLSAFYHRDNV